jgi:hypothetical protein
MDFNKYNPLKQTKPPLNDWTESVPVVLLSEALKIVGKKHGISLHLADDGCPTLRLCPGLKGGDQGSVRWDVVEQVYKYFMDAIEDLTELIGAGKLKLPQNAAGPSRQIESIRVAKPR